MARTSVYGVYRTTEGVEQAGNSLVNSGFFDADISVFLPNEIGSGDHDLRILVSVQCRTSDQIRRAQEIVQNTMEWESNSRPATETPAALVGLLSNAPHISIHHRKQ
jgi:hypothetical protein